MKKELQDKLINKYPTQFGLMKDITKKQNRPFMPIAFGVEVGDGWFLILDNLLANIQNHINNVEKHDRRQIKSWFWRHIMKAQFLTNQIVRRFHRQF